MPSLALVAVPHGCATPVACKRGSGHTSRATIGFTALSPRFLAASAAAAVLLLANGAAGAAAAASPPSSDEHRAAATLVSSSGVRGAVFFTQFGTGPTTVSGMITGLSPGLHGFHVHEKGNLGDNCNAAGAHYNPFNKTHGAPTDTTRHAGDLGNIVALKNGTAEFSINDGMITLTGPYSVVGRAVVVHSLKDDEGRGDSSEPGVQGKTSLTTGNAGGRIACGVIEEK